MSKHVEADAIVFRSGDGRCELKLVSGLSHVGLYANTDKGSMSLIAESGQLPVLKSWEMPENGPKPALEPRAEPPPSDPPAPPTQALSETTAPYVVL